MNNRSRLNTNRDRSVIDLERSCDIQSWCMLTWQLLKGLHVQLGMYVLPKRLECPGTFLLYL